MKLFLLIRVAYILMYYLRESERSPTYLLTYILTYLLTLCSGVLLENLTLFQLVKKFPAFYGTRRLITAFTSTRRLSLSWAKLIQSMPPHPISWRSILILSSNLRLGQTHILPLNKSFFRVSSQYLYTALRNLSIQIYTSINWFTLGQTNTYALCLYPVSDSCIFPFISLWIYLSTHRPKDPSIHW